MDNEALLQKIERAKELLRTVRHAAVATTNADGSPHNSPVFMTFDPGLNGYWSSTKVAQHSRNIARTGKIFIVLFDSMGSGGGLYIAASARELAGDELARALGVFNAAIVKANRSPLQSAHFLGDSPQRLFAAVPERLWVNMSKRDETGRVLGDWRAEISLKDLQ